MTTDRPDDPPFKPSAPREDQSDEQHGPPVTASDIACDNAARVIRGLLPEDLQFQHELRDAVCKITGELVDSRSLVEAGDAGRKGLMVFLEAYRDYLMASGRLRDAAYIFEHGRPSDDDDHQ